MVKALVTAAIMVSRRSDLQGPGGLEKRLVRIFRHVAGRQAEILLNCASVRK